MRSVAGVDWESIARGMVDGVTTFDLDEKYDDFPSDIPQYWCQNKMGLRRVVIPNNVTIIRSGAFQYCDNLQYFYLPSSVTEMQGQVFYPKNIRLANYRFDFDIDSIAAQATRTFTSLNGNPLVFSHNLYVDGALFTGTLEIPEGVTEIKDFVFRSLANVDLIVVPSTVTRIGSRALYVEADLSKGIKVLATAPPTLGSTDAIGSLNWSSPIYVPDASVDAYKAAWSNHASRIKPLSEFVGGVILDYQLVSECWHSERSAA